MKRRITLTFLGLLVPVLIAIVWRLNSAKPITDSPQAADSQTACELGPLYAQTDATHIRPAATHSASEKEALGGTSAAADPDLKAEALDRQAQSIPDTRLSAALDALIGKDTDEASQLRQLLVRRWAELDPRAAGQWASRLALPMESREAIGQVALTWVSVDPGAATLWATALPNGNARQTAL